MFTVTILQPSVLNFMSWQTISAKKLPQPVMPLSMQLAIISSLDIAIGHVFSRWCVPNYTFVPCPARVVVKPPFIVINSIIINIEFNF
jgi:hypothetical protein